MPISFTSQFYHVCPTSAGRCPGINFKGTQRPWGYSPREKGYISAWQQNLAAAHWFFEHERYESDGELAPDYQKATEGPYIILKYEPPEVRWRPQTVQMLRSLSTEWSWSSKRLFPVSSRLKE